MALLPTASFSLQTRGGRINPVGGNGKACLMKTKTSTTKNSVSSSPLCRGFLLILLLLAYIALAPLARAACEDGCDLTNESTFQGDNALSSNTAGFNNTAIGSSALASNSTGAANTATGQQALASNTTGFNNTADGAGALAANSTGGGNTATGQLALTNNVAGSNNTAVGMGALSLSSGSNNTAIGASAGDSVGTGNDNVFIGFTAGEMVQGGSHNIEIAHHGTPGDIATIRIGTKKNQKNTYIAGITGVTVAGGVGVIVDASGHLGTVTSSARFKDNVRPMDKASEAILALKPVTFCYKKEIDPEGIPQFGLVAEQVEKVNPDLIARDEQGKPFTVRYEAVNAMLLNEFLKEHRKNEEQEAMIAQLENQVKALAVGLQKVSAHLELSNPALKTVVYDQ